MGRNGAPSDTRTPPFHSLFSPGVRRFWFAPPAPNGRTKSGSSGLTNRVPAFLFYAAACLPLAHRLWMKKNPTQLTAKVK